MRNYCINTICYFPINYTSDGRLIKRVKIDVNNNIKLDIDKQPLNYPQGLLNPNEAHLLSQKQQENKLVEVEKHFYTNSDYASQSDILTSVAEVEDFVSWLTYLTLKDFRIVKWGEVSSQAVKNGHTLSLTVGRKFNLPVDTSILEESGEVLKVASNEPPITINNFEMYTSLKIPNEIKSVLRWYRKGMLSYFPEEKIIYWVTGLEILSSLLSEDVEIVNKCNNCGEVTRSRPSVNKSALFDFINTLGFNKNKTFNVIQKYRNKYAHGGEDNFVYGSDEIGIVVNATYSLLTLFLNYCINTKKLLPVEYLKRDCQHLLIENKESLLDSIRLLEQSGLHKKRKSVQ